MKLNLGSLIEETPFIDTHEHLIEEQVRIEGKAGWGLFPCNDWAYLFWHYLQDDLASAGMPDAERGRFFAPDETTEAKYRLVAPYWDKVKYTGYGQAVRHTLRGLYGIDDLTAQTAPQLAEKYHNLVRPGFYKTVLNDKCHISHCQVNSLSEAFCETAQPDLLKQDIGLPSLTYPDAGPESLARQTGTTIRTLDDYLNFLTRFFADKAPRAVAVKSQCAYWRRLDFAKVSQETAEEPFARLVTGAVLSPDDRKIVEDFLFDWCVGKATEYRLPVKLHTGYYASHNHLPLHRICNNAADLVPLLNAYPDTNFVLMHIGYPYSHELMALAKNYRNVFIDLCWAWIINPAATTRFVYEFLLTVPANKLLSFGGDYIVVENIYGHAKIARQGLTQAMEGLVQDKWLTESEARTLIPQLMHGNAEALFNR